MRRNYTEKMVQDHIYTVGLHALIPDEACRIDAATPKSTSTDKDFSLWKLLKTKAIDKISRVHSSVQSGQLIAKGTNLAVDGTRPMQLDMLGVHSDGIFVVELKIDKGAERNAFSELLAYSNYIASVFPGCGPKDITNVLIAPIFAKITKQAFLYDLLIAERDTIIYLPDFPDGNATSLSLSLFIPDDTDFEQFANYLLSADNMTCVVMSFPDIAGWIDPEGIGEELPDHTVQNLSRVSQYAAQLMESENFHGFCFIRRRRIEITRALGGYESSLVVCALNPFEGDETERTRLITDQIAETYRDDFVSLPRSGFVGRLIRTSQKTIRDSVRTNHPTVIDLAHWGAFSTSITEVAVGPNFGFHPTGLFREAYFELVEALYRENEVEDGTHDLSPLKVTELFNWLRAWMFVEGLSRP